LNKIFQQAKIWERDRSTHNLLCLSENPNLLHHFSTFLTLDTGGARYAGTRNLKDAWVSVRTVGSSTLIHSRHCVSRLISLPLWRCHHPLAAAVTGRWYVCSRHQLLSTPRLTPMT